MRKTMLMLLALIVSVNVGAVDFEEDGISYGILSADGHTVEVVNNNSAYVGDVVIPARVSHDGTTYTVAAIHFQAFFKCADLHSVSIPETVADMGRYSFTQCTSLEEVTLPKNATAIPDGMFWGCTSLKSVELPAGVTEIGEYAFANCSALKDITLPSGLVFMGKAALMGTAIESFTLPQGVTDLQPYLLALTTKLSSVTLHNRLSTIGECAFQGNTQLTTISIPESVTIIEASAFAQCPQLESIAIPDGVTLLPEKCFYNDMALRRVVVGKGVTSVGADCFARYKGTATAPRLEDVYLLSDVLVSGGESFLDEACAKATLHVPSALVEAYKAQPGWQRFNVVAIKDGELSGIGSVKAAAAVSKHIYTIGGIRCGKARRGITVADGKKIINNIN